MWSLFTVAPYACILGLLLFIYFIAYPFVEYIRDPKGESASGGLILLTS
jgi:hypothetical protein